MRIGYVCTNYNNSLLTCDATSSLIRCAADDCRIVVVDNHSDHENVEILERLSSRHSQIELILNEENVGYFNGLNIGIRHLRRTQPSLDLVIIGNNDLLFPEDFLEKVQASASIFERYAVVSPDIITLDGFHQNPHVISRISPIRELIYDLYYSNYYLALIIARTAKLTRAFTDRPDERFHEVPQEIYQGYGACYLLGPLFFQHFEELWAPTFMLHEEYFLSKQLQDQDMTVFYEPGIKLLHRCRGATGDLGNRTVWELGRNAQKVYRQYVKIFGPQQGGTQ